ncbi:MAG TPA: hypothetical protein VK789_09640, partial [Bryobacteraceae bacterium]|nr:hypothetical protein [Bryobacteraceae bacterium]
AGLLAFFLTFDTHSAVLPLAADMLLLVPHLAAVLLAWRRQAFWSGVAAGIGFLFNAKALFVLAACALFAWPNVPALVAGFAVPNLAALGWLAGTGSLTPYLDQVWRWPAQYTASPIVADPVWNGLVRTLNWLGFHVALVIGAVIFWWRRANWKFLAWAVICYAGVVLGWRFFPRYFFLLLPPLAIAAARGLTLWGQAFSLPPGFRPARVGQPEGPLERTSLHPARWLRLAAVIVAMAVPFVRFAPRYISLADWNDLALDEDSRDASRIALANAPPGGSLFVWGYRPEIYVYTRLRPATRFLESQAMTGVPADRHLTQSGVVLTEGTHEAREQLARSRPDVLIDSLGLYNPALTMDHYSELRPWLAAYRVIGRTKGSVVYIRDPITIGR